MPSERREPGPLYTTIPELIAHMLDCGLSDYAEARLSEIEALYDEERATSGKLYEALEQFVDHFGDPFKTARAALAKANPEEKQNG